MTTTAHTPADHQEHIHRTGQQAHEEAEELVDAAHQRHPVQVGEHRGQEADQHLADGKADKEHHHGDQRGDQRLDQFGDQAVGQVGGTAVHQVGGALYQALFHGIGQETRVFVHQGGQIHRACWLMVVWIWVVSPPLKKVVKIQSATRGDSSAAPTSTQQVAQKLDQPGQKALCI